MAKLTRNQLRLVHIEDNPDFAGLCAHHLHAAGFVQPVVHCKNGIEALDYFLTIDPERPPHAVLLDLHMPRMDGLEVLRWLRCDYSAGDLAIYLLTSSDDPEDRRKAANAGVTKYLLKTPTFSQLIAELDLLILRENRVVIQQTANFAGDAVFKPGSLIHEVPMLQATHGKDAACVAAPRRK